MEILKAATIWARAEMTSSYFFMFFGFVYMALAIALWQWSGTALSKSLFIPLLIVGGILVAVGIGFYTSNKSKLANFETEYNTSPSKFLQSEKERTEQTMKTYRNVALKVFSAIIIIAVLAAVFISHPTVRAICISIVAFFTVLVLLDSFALKRMETYNKELQAAERLLEK